MRPSYQVIDRDGKPLEQSRRADRPDSVARTVPDPWWDKVYGTLELADHPAEGPDAGDPHHPAPDAHPTPDQ